MACDCIFGSCIDVGQRICQCFPGYEGERCESIFVDFAKKNNEEDELQSEEIVIIAAVTACVFVALLTICCFSWKRWVTIKRRHETSRNLLRRQSRATIEGYSPKLAFHDPSKNTGHVVDIYEDSDAKDLVCNRSDSKVNVLFSLQTDI